MKVSEAYEVLGIEDGASMDDAKAAYRQIALRTHPDKNPNNPDATAEFQAVGEAYNLIMKHLDRSSKPSFGCGRPGCQCQDDDFDAEEDYDDFFFKDLFEHVMRGGGRFYFFGQPGSRPFRPKPETPEEYRERVRRSRQEQLEAAERRKRDAIARKERQANEREQERIDAEKRHKTKLQEKKAKLEKERKSSEERARALKKKAQENRSAVFAAARQGDFAFVKKGIWENAVDAAGGEITLDGSPFVMNEPKDAKETLLHIAAAKGDLGLIEWLDSHSADPEERNGHDLTAVQIAVKLGHIAVVEYFFENYPPKDNDHTNIYASKEGTNLLKLAVQSCQFEIVDLILGQEIVSKDEITEAIVWASSASGTKVLQGTSPRTEVSADIMKLLHRFGDIPENARISKDNTTTARSKTRGTPKASPEDVPKPKSSLSSKPSQPKKHLSQKNHRGLHGRGGGRGQAVHSGRPNH